MRYFAILLYDAFFIGGAIYLYGWKGWSGWWIVLGLIIGMTSGGFKK